MEMEYKSVNNSMMLITDKVCRCLSCGHQRQIDNDINTGDQFQYATCEGCGVEHTTLRAMARSFEQWGATIHKTTFEDGNVVYALLGIKYVYVSKKGTPRIVGTNATKRLRIEPSGRMTALANGRQQFSVAGIHNVLSSFRTWGENNILVTMADYYLSRNPRLKDLIAADSSPDAFFFNVQSKADRAKAYRLFDKHGTKAAREFLAGGVKHKGLVNLMASVTYNGRAHVQAMVTNGYTADQIFAFVGGCGPRNLQVYLQCLASLAIMGYSYKKAINILNATIDYHASEGERLEVSYALEDSVRLIERMNALDIDHSHLERGSVNRLHDQLSELFNNVGQVKELEKLGKAALPATNLEDMTAQGLTVTVCTKAMQLLDAGKAMTICVGSYIDMVVKKQTIIALVMDGERHVACLQVTDKALVQAKLPYNKRVAINTVVHSVVTKWVDLNKLDVATYDMQEGACIDAADLDFNLQVNAGFDDGFPF